MKRVRERSRRPGTRGPAAWIGWAFLGGLLALGSPGSVEAQEDEARKGCRCTDRSGEEIENCVCIRTATPDVWTFRLDGPRRSRIGVSLSVAQDAEADRRGAVVAEVLEDGPAEEAGIREGDAIVRVGDHSVFDPLPDVEDEEALDLDESIPAQRLLALAADLEPGEPVEVVVERDGRRRTLTVTPEKNPGLFGGLWSPDSGEAAAELQARMEELRRRTRELRHRDLDFRPDPPGPEGRLRTVGPEPDLWTHSIDPCLGGNGVWRGLVDGCVEGLELVELNPQLGEYFGTEEGVLVVEVHEDSRFGLQPGDVILAIDGREVTSPEHARRILRSYDEHEEITFRIVRDGARTEVEGRRR